MSTVGELVEEFRDTVREKDETNSHFSNKEIIRWLDIAQNKICTKTDILVKEYTVSGGSIIGTRKYALPDAFRSCLRVRYDKTKITPSTRRTEDNLNDKWDDNTDRATPDRYFIQDTNVYLIKSPDVASKEIEIIYVAMATSLTAFSQTPEILSQLQYLLVSYALYRGYRKMKQPGVGGDYKVEFDDGIYMARGLANNRNRDLVFQFKNVTVEVVPLVRTPVIWG